MFTLQLEIGLTVLGLVLLLVDAFVPKLHRHSLGIVAVVGLAAALGILIFGGATPAPEDLVPFYATDNLAIFYKGLALITTLAVVIISLEYAPVITRFVTGHPERHHEAGLAEFYAMPLFVCVGLMVMASAKDLITIFVALELTTVSFYVLVAYMRRSELSLEAGVKYLILGALSTGFLVYGFAWIYGVTGETTLAGIGQKLQTWQGDTSGLLLGSALILTGLGFKVAAAPFQIWVPDVYQGAPTPITAFLSVGSKASGFIVLTRFVDILAAKGSVLQDQILNVLLVVACATVLVGNLGALRQTNFKRLLGYSSIAHAGFLVLALASHAAPSGFTPGMIVAFYLATYLPMTLICFLVLAAARAQGISEEISSFRGLAQRSPWLALVLTLALASLAGLPLTAGFLGKFFVFFSLALNGGYVGLVFALIGAAAGFYYYLKIILAIYSKPEEELPPIKLNGLSHTLLAVFAASIVVFGVWFNPVKQALGTPVAAVTAAK